MALFSEAEAASANAQVPRLVLRGITKQFATTLANDHVDLVLQPGEIHALLGENGAGKSTLVKIIYGVLRADAGEIAWEGQPTVVTSPNHARALGIGMVFQHFSMFDSLTVVENIALGLDHKEPMKVLAARIREVSTRYGLSVEPERHVHELTVGERQRVEIVRCLLRDPKLLIMDEPTSVLTPQEANNLFVVLKSLAAEGRTILYISHKLDEIRAICDRATVLRGGKVVGAADPKSATARELAEMMIGAELTLPTRAAAPANGEVRLSVRNLSTTLNSPFATNIKDASLEVRSGEILGIAGVAGNGHAELLAALSGEMLSPVDGMVNIMGVAAGHLGPRQRRELGLAFVPEERLGRGAVPELSLAENAMLSAYARENMVERGLIRHSRARRFAEKVIDAFDVVSGGHHAEARSLSGGNLQKFIIGREILQKPKLLIVASPTWGVDAGAAAAIHQALIDLAHEGTAVLVVSQDLDELFAISDRICVICAGRLSESQPTHKTSVDQIGLLMGGIFDQGSETDDV